MLNIIDEFTRECLAIRIGCKLNSTEVIDALSDLFILRGVPCHVRSDNGSEFITKAVREWIGTVICTGHGRKADHALKLKLGHPTGTGHVHEAR